MVTQSEKQVAYAIAQTIEWHQQQITKLMELDDKQLKLVTIYLGFIEGRLDKETCEVMMDAN